MRRITPPFRPLLAVLPLAVTLAAARSGGTPEEAAPHAVCVAAGTCTLVRTVATEGGLDTVALLERAPLHADPRLPFASWLAWPHAPVAVRAAVWGGGSLHRERPTEVGTFLLRAVPRVRVAEEPDSLLVLITVDPLRTGAPQTLPEAIAIAEERKLLTPEQQTRAARERQAEVARTQALTGAWLALTRAPADLAARTRLVEALGGDVPGLDPQTFLTSEQRTALRRAGLALDGHILLEDGSKPDISFRLRVEEVPLEELVRNWNAGLGALVHPLERVPRPLLLVAPGFRHEEVTFTLDVKEGNEDRMSQVVRRLLAVPGLSTDGKQLPPPGL